MQNTINYMPYYDTWDGHSNKYISCNYILNTTFPCEIELFFQCDNSKLNYKTKNKMPSTILRADNSASIGGINNSPLSQQQTEQVFHYKYELSL